MRRLVIACIAMLTAMFGLATPAFAAAPTISSFTPTSGPLRTQVKITGSNFVAPVTVKFNNVAATSVVVNSSTQVTAQVPGSANSGPIKVTTSGGTATSTTSFTVTPGLYVPTAVGPPGTKVSVYFSGLTAYEAVDVYFDSTDLKLVSASGTGSGVATPIVPKASPGEHYFTAVGRKSGNSAQATFTVRSDWPQYRSDAARTGSNPTESTLGAANATKLTRAWTSLNTNSSYSQPVVAGGVVYAANDSIVTAVSLGSGSQIWKRVLDAGSVNSLTVSGSTLVLTTYNGRLLGLNTATGTTRYDTAFPGRGYYSAVALVGGIGYAEADDSTGSGTSLLIAFDATTGSSKWTTSLPIACKGVTVADNVIYRVCDDYHLHAQRTSNGSDLFEVGNTLYYHYGTPTVVDGLVVTAADPVNEGVTFDAVVAYDAKTGSAAWSGNLGYYVSSTATLAIADDAVIVRGYDGSFNPYASAFGAADGAPLWVVSAPGSISSPVAYANGLLYLPGVGSTTALDAESGRRVSSIRGSVFAVVVDAGVITVGSDGALLRYVLPTTATAAGRPRAATLRPNRALRVAS